MIEFRVTLTEKPDCIRSSFDVFMHADSTDQEKAALEHLVELMKADTVIRLGKGLFVETPWQQHHRS